MSIYKAIGRVGQCGLTVFGALLLFAVANTVSAQTKVRSDISLNADWQTIANDASSNTYSGFELPLYNTTQWKTVDVPHNWDDYGGYRRLLHGNRHGYAWYRKVFKVKAAQPGKRYFLWFEGVGSYATVWLNGKKVGYHAGGRTSFTVDVSDEFKPGKPNILAVRADHPANITDLPWVCGACSNETGFSEGSQPMGIFRPVHLIITNPVRVQPFGIHIWNDTTINERQATLHLETEVKNYSAVIRSVIISNCLQDSLGHLIAQSQTHLVLAQGLDTILSGQLKVVNPHLWWPNKPYLYHLITNVVENGQVTDRETTEYGIRTISWPIGRAGNNKQFLVNGKPFFINGIAEYEHLLGQSHAFSHEQIHTRVMQVKAAGFNAFRDAHQPHNLEYQHYWDEMGILWWPQFSAHIWYDTPAFRQNYKALLVDWVKERRNSPSIILWGLENESKLPADFAKECSDIIRKLDPTASSQRKITTCNGGEGTDWDVPQNWTGTYGGDPQTYAADVQKQLLIGEYGAWRSLGLHTEGAFMQNGPLSEDRMVQLMETKVRLAEQVRDRTCGQFFWLLNSHDNPGRVQSGEGYREMDRLGPINYKGLFTPWAQPVDAFYMFRANYALKDKEPMVYIPMHTWPDRWLTSGKKDSIAIYSNCDEVELFNDAGALSLGKKQGRGIGTHFLWDAVDIRYNVLYAVGYVNGKAVAHDFVVLNHLPKAPHFNDLIGKDEHLIEPQAHLKYVYRVHCGGADYTDHNGNLWQADVHLSGKDNWGSTSWTDDYAGMPAMFGSQQRSTDPIKGSTDQPLFQTYRYGRDKLKYYFPLPAGAYTVELYFTEPWYGTGGGLDCTGWRLFDVALNGQTRIKNLDIWKAAGYNHPLKKTLQVLVGAAGLTISFPKVLSGQAIISAIAIASNNQNAKAAPASASLIQSIQPAKNWQPMQWMDTGDKLYGSIEISKLPSNLYGAEWLKAVSAPYTALSFKVSAGADVFVAADTAIKQKPDWLSTYNDTKTLIQTDAAGGRMYRVYQQRFTKGSTIVLGDKGSGVDPQQYIIAALPLSQIEPPTDLRPTLSYKADVAKFNPDSLSLTQQAGKACLKFNKQAGSLGWNVSVGVANVYALRVKYLNLGTNTINLHLQLLAADGSTMTDTVLPCAPTPDGKWKVANASTGNMINAGNYSVVLTAATAQGLCISGLEIQ